jgi:hypothetical protein
MLLGAVAAVLVPAAFPGAGLPVPLIHPVEIVNRS